MSIKTVKPSKLLRGQSRRIQGITSTQDDVKLLGAKFKGNVTDAIKAPGMVLERTIEVASTLTIPIHDPEGELRRSKLMRSRFDVELDDLWFRLVRVQRTDRDTLTLTLEDREVAIIRELKGALKAARSKVTRAEFVVGQVLEARPRIPVYCPELHTRQPIRNARESRDDESERDLRRDFGIGAKAKLTVKGEAASQAQRELGDRVLRIAVSYGAPYSALLALMAACIVESLISNPTGGEGTSSGILQVTSSTAAAKRVNPTNVEAVVRIFLSQGFTGQGGAIAHAEAGIDPGRSAQLAQGSAFPDRYGQYLGEAKQWVRAFIGGSDSASFTREEAKRYQFERKPGENAWDNAKRLGDEVNWRHFCSAGIFYYAAEADLLRSRSRLIVAEGEPGVDTVTWDWDQGQPVTEVKVTGRVEDWAAPPGAIAEVRDQGPADGRYLVSTIKTNLAGATSELADITLKRPTKALPEPAPETRSVTKTFGGRKTGAKAKGGVKIPSTKAGAPAWGGARYIFDQFIHDFMRERDLSPGSQKRDNNTGKGVSDHWIGSPLAYATDYSTFSGEGAARALAAALGNNSWQPNSYDTFNIQIDGHTYRVQILWGSAIEHGDHVHVGLNLVS